MLEKNIHSFARENRGKHTIKNYFNTIFVITFSHFLSWVVFREWRKQEPSHIVSLSSYIKLYYTIFYRTYV